MKPKSIGEFNVTCLISGLKSDYFFVLIVIYFFQYYVVLSRFGISKYQGVKNQRIVDNFPRPSSTI